MKLHARFIKRLYNDQHHSEVSFLIENYQHGIEKQLMGAFRAVRKVGKRQVGDKEVMMYKCYYGSSRFTVKEMNELIDTVLRYCAEHNIETELLDYDTV